MTTVLAQLREQRNSHALEMRNLLDKNQSTWNNELQAKYEEHDQSIQMLDKQIGNHQRMMDLQAEERFGLQDQGGTNANNSGDTSPAGKAKAMYNKWLRGGDNAISAEEWAVIRNTMSTTTGSEGGYTVQSEVAATVINAMKNYSAMRGSGLCGIIQTAAGNPLSYPTSDGTSEEGEVIPENQTATDEDATFGTLSLNVFKFSSKVITVPIELIQDASIDVEAFVRDRIAQRLGRITERKFTLGSGTGEPKGIVTASSVGVAAATGNAATITYDHLVDLEHSVDRAYRVGAAFMMNDLTLAYVRKIKDDYGRPLFVPGCDVATGGEPATLMNRPLVINPFMDDIGASAKPIGFGNLSYYKIRDVMQMSLYRFTDSAYTKKGQVGFLAWSRHGGNLIDVGGAFKLFQNSAT
ncbi:MAG TPA: phage major capsid protein [Limnobacter sp.]|uniref:phage major capsid protein n=1 Tax=Limnobacter sp. TaxID=2003368 RepID=UPI002E32F0C9|nr:phage major capsid protein [Limnobacter sp.]HEX5486504.1 phage major capsid protein [Limnobacter sp.]